MAQKNFSLVSPNLSKNSEQKLAQGPSTTGFIKDILSRSGEIKDQVIVIKLPSVVISNDALLTSFSENVHLISTCGAKVAIVHDHTNLVSDTLKLIGFDEKLIDNIIVVDHKSAQIIEMVISGYINKLIVSKLSNLGCLAVGISGKDGNLIQAKKTKLVHKKDNSKVIDVGFVSEPVMFNPEILFNFEENNIIPVISPIASDLNGCTHILDVNTTASIVSFALDADHLMFLDDETIFKENYARIYDIQPLQKMQNKQKQNPKTLSIIRAAISSLENGNNCVHFVNAENPDSLLLSIFL